MINDDEKRTVAFGLAGLGVIFLVVAAITNCSAGGADNFAHFNIARWAFRYPHLFLDHWGKPVFTILIAPFTQIGFYGARFFNIIAGLLAAWISYLLVSRWKLPKAWLAPVFVIFSPYFFVLMFSGMTEILFSLILILAIWLYFNNRFVFSAFILSFIFLVRTEGFIFFPIFFAALVLKRKFAAIPFLLSGFLIFSIVGWLYHYHNFWWLIDDLPYVGGTGGIYGSGKWYHFLEKMHGYLGFVVSFFFLAGMFIWISDWVRVRFRLKSEEFFRLFLLGGCFWGYLAAHSYLWWIGEVSLGLLRVMVGVVPLAAIIAVSGWGKMEKMISHKSLKFLFLAVTIIFTIINGVFKYKPAFSTDPRLVVLDKAVNWLRQTDYFQQHLIIHDPYLAFSANIDAWDSRRLQYGFSDPTAPERALPNHSVFIWDAHFSQNEGRIAADKILENPYFELLAYFEPKYPFKVLGGYDYGVMVFRKVEEKATDNFLRLENLKKAAEKGELVYSDSIDFECSSAEVTKEEFRLALNDSCPGFCYQLSDENEFSPSFSLNKKQLKITNRLEFEVNFDFCAESRFNKNEMLMVFSLEKHNQSYYYIGDDILPFMAKTNKWQNARFRFQMPEEVKKNTRIKLYIWNRSKKKFKLDNFKLRVYLVKKQ